MALLDLLQIKVVEQAPGLGRVEVVVGRQHLRNLGIMHGGMLGALLDSALGMAAGSLAAADQFVVTVQLNINFIRPAWEGERLVATGEVQHAGRQTAVARGEVRTAEGVLVGSGSGTFLYLRHTDPEQRRYDREAEITTRNVEDAARRPAGPGSSDRGRQETGV
jgi:acyl-coenzyme A thioesterase 13